MNQLAQINAARLPRCITHGSARPGWVYAIRDDHSEAVKIGFSVNPSRRFGQLQTANPNPLRFIGAMPSVEAFERLLHWTYRERRRAGEWFDDADGEVSNILYLAFSEGDE